jgi:hypothetical protein
MKIYVDTQEQKDRLLNESEYIHDFAELVEEDGYTKVIGLDSDKAGTLMHIYMNPDMIVVNKTKEEIDEGYRNWVAYNKNNKL